MSRIKQGGNLGLQLLVSGTVDATLNAVIDALDDPADIIGRLVTIADGYVFATTGDGETPNGRIEAIKGNATSDYTVTVDLFCLPLQNSTAAFLSPTRIVNLPYSGTIAFGDTVIINGADGTNVDDGTTGGHGCVLAKDVPSGYVDVAY